MSVEIKKTFKVWMGKMDIIKVYKWKKLSQKRATSHLKEKNKGNLTKFRQNRKRWKFWGKLSDKKTKSEKSSVYLKGVLEGE